MIVTTGSDKNPDNSFKYNREIAEEAIEVSSIEEAQKVCIAFIRHTQIGGGNWSGGDVYQDGVKIARISYNGRAWTPEDENAVLILEQPNY